MDGYAKNANNCIYLKVGYIDSLKYKEISTDSYFGPHIYLRTNKILIHTYIRFTIGGKAIKGCSIVTVRKFTQ